MPCMCHNQTAQTNKHMLFELLPFFLCFFLLIITPPSSTSSSDSLSSLASSPLDSRVNTSISTFISNNWRVFIFRIAIVPVCWFACKLVNLHSQVTWQECTPNSFFTKYQIDFGLFKSTPLHLSIAEVSLRNSLYFPRYRALLIKVLTGKQHGGLSIRVGAMVRIVFGVTHLPRRGSNWYGWMFISISESLSRSCFAERHLRKEMQLRSQLVSTHFSHGQKENIQEPPSENCRKVNYEKHIVWYLRN